MTRLVPGAIMGALFAEWDDERGAPSDETGAWAEWELDRAFAEQAEHDREHGAASSGSG
jgi:hypothetical protein